MTIRESYDSGVDANLRLMRYFVAVGETLHFGRAAERLYISQPALSQQIRKLEDDLGIALFLRDRRSVQLTPAGAGLLSHAQAVIASADVFTRAAQRESRMHRGQMVVGFHTRWPDGFLPRVIRAYRDVRPGVSLDLAQHDFSDTSAGLRLGTSDAALVHLPLTAEGLRWQELSTEPRVMMVAQDHPLADSLATTVAEVLGTGTPWGVPPDTDPVWRDFWSAAPERAAAGGSDVARVQPMTHEALFDSVASGQSVALTYASLGRVYAPEGVRFIPMEDLTPAVLAVAWRSEDTRAHIGDFVAAVCAASGHERNQT